MEHVRLKHDAWVLVADGAKALFLRNEGDEEYPNLKVVEVQQDASPAESGTGSQAHRPAEDKFARDTAEALNRAALANKFSEVVVVAPPKALAELRAHFHKEAQSRIIAELHKTLTGRPINEIERILTGTSLL